MPDVVLTNPAAPLASAQRLVAAQQRATSLPVALVAPVTSILGKWLAVHPDCRAGASEPDRNWCEAARHAHRKGQPCTTFRRRKHVTEEAENGLKWIALAAGYAGDVRRKPAHDDPDVRSEAKKLMRALHNRRMTWDQLANGLKRVRSLVQTRGRQRARDKPIRDPLMLMTTGDLMWREIVTARELASAGHANGWCTHEPEYVQKLKSKHVRFFVLEGEESDGHLALVSVRSRSRRVEGARAPGNEPIPFVYRSAVKELLDQLGINLGCSADLLALGLTSALPDVDLDKPDFAVGELSVWLTSAATTMEDDDEDLDEDEDGATVVVTTPTMLIRLGSSFALLRPRRHRMSNARFVLEQGHGAGFDSDDLLGQLLVDMSTRT